MSLNLRKTRAIVPVLVVLLAWPTEPALAIREAAEDAAPTIAAMSQGRLPRPLRLKKWAGGLDRSNFDHDDLINESDDDEPRALPFILSLSDHSPCAAAILTVEGHLGPAPRWLVSVHARPIRLLC